MENQQTEIQLNEQLEHYSDILLEQLKEKKQIHMDALSYVLTAIRDININTVYINNYNHENIKCIGDELNNHKFDDTENDLMIHIFLKEIVLQIDLYNNRINTSISVD